MPFLPELHYFYLYLKQHIEEIHNIECIRGDAEVLTIPLLEKINDYIKGADVLISDCTGRNPNVFYELGIAHAHEKKIILITQDPVKEAPADIRHFEFIQYELHKHVEFFERLDNALRNVFVYRYEKLHEMALQIFRQFRRDTNAQVELASKDVFVQRLIAAEHTRELPRDDDEFGITELVLPRIISDSSDIGLMSTITRWMADKYPPIQ